MVAGEVGDGDAGFSHHFPLDAGFLVGVAGAIDGEGELLVAVGRVALVSRGLQGADPQLRIVVLERDADRRDVGAAVLQAGCQFRIAEQGEGRSLGRCFRDGIGDDRQRQRLAGSACREGERTGEDAGLAIVGPARGQLGEVKVGGDDVVAIAAEGDLAVDREFAFGIAGAHEVVGQVAGGIACVAFDHQTLARHQVQAQIVA